MSLINDALKRASKAQKGGSAPAAGPTMQPALPQARPRMPLILVLTLSLAVAAGCSVWLFLQWSRERDQNRPPTAPVLKAPAVAAAANAAGPAKVETNRPADGPAQSKPLPIAPPLAAVAAPAAALAKTSAVPTVLSNAKPNTVLHATNSPPAVKPAVLAAAPAPAPASNGSPSSAAAPALARPFPRLKLQGILFSEKRPQAMINDNVCSVGDEVDGARVVKIERRQVVVSWDGREKALAPE
jgi:hypothetical protein